MASMINGGPILKLPSGKGPLINHLPAKYSDKLGELVRLFENLEDAPILVVRWFCVSWNPGGC